MPLTFDALLELITAKTLLAPVQQLLGPCQVIVFHYKKLSGGLQGGVADQTVGMAGVARFSGSALRGGDSEDISTELLPWSLILKVLPPSLDTPDSLEASRERYIYESGILNNLPGDLIAPQFYGVLNLALMNDRNDPNRDLGTINGLWLEDLATLRTGFQSGMWTLDRYGMAAYHLGQFNAAFIAHPRLSEPGLSREWLRGRMVRRTGIVESLSQFTDNPLVKRLYTPETLAFALHLWTERERYLSVLERMPQTFCHLDSFRRNLFALHQEPGREQTAAVDWAFSGIAPPGCDVAPLVWVSAIFQEITVEQVEILDKLAFQRYRQGLEDGGWHGNPRWIRLAYLIMALPNIAIPTEFPLFLDEQHHLRLEQGFGRTITEIIDHWANLMTVAMRYADEFDQLLREVEAEI